MFHVGDQVRCITTSFRFKLTAGLLYTVIEYDNQGDDIGWNSVTCDDGMFRIVNHTEVAPLFELWIRASLVPSSQQMSVPQPQWAPSPFSGGAPIPKPQQSSGPQTQNFNRPIGTPPSQPQPQLQSQHASLLPYSYIGVDMGYATGSQPQIQSIPRTGTPFYTPNQVESECDCGGFKTYKTMSPESHSDWCKSLKNILSS